MCPFVNASVCARVKYTVLKCFKNAYKVLHMLHVQDGACGVCKANACSFKPCQRRLCMMVDASADHPGVPAVN